ncbi:uncharacterized protein LOC143420650 [Maylandia zebra]|uniref:uncharacterized protein LOC143420650 n=1 Tax=Maylandia zebra TaxID=106582 RepID=UPI00403D4B25
MSEDSHSHYRLDPSDRLNGLGQRRKRPKKARDALQTVDRHDHITRTWCESDLIFQSTLRDLNQEVRGQLMLRAGSEPRERSTLLNLKENMLTDRESVAVR